MVAQISFLHKSEFHIITFPDDLTPFHMQKYTPIHAANRQRTISHLKTPVSPMLSVMRRTYLLKEGWVSANLRTVPTNSNIFLHGLLNMWEKQILTSVIEIQKGKLGVTTHFLKMINQQHFEKALK